MIPLAILPFSASTSFSIPFLVKSVTHLLWVGSLIVIDEQVGLMVKICIGVGYLAGIKFLVRIIGIEVLVRINWETSKLIRI